MCVVGIQEADDVGTVGTGPEIAPSSRLENYFIGREFGRGMS